jgi:predicted nuclease of predicted toxin-antitoxin system
VKLLLDANISYRLVKSLEIVYNDVIHIDKPIGEMVTDIEIWNYALKYDFIIVTNDLDFINLINIMGFPPKIVLLKTGNQSNNYINHLLISKLNNISDLYHTNDYGLLEIM